MDLNTAWKTRLNAHQESKSYYDVYQSCGAEHKQLLAQWENKPSSLERELQLVKADLCLIRQHEAYAQYGRIRVMADHTWLTHVQDLHGNIDVEWKHRDNPADPYGPPFTDCHLSTGEVFLDEDLSIIEINPVYLKLTWRKRLRLLANAKQLQDKSRAVHEKYRLLPDDQRQSNPELQQANLWWFQAHDLLSDANEIWCEAVKQVCGPSPIHWIKKDDGTFDCCVASETFHADVLETELALES